MQETRVQSLGQEDTLEEEMTIHSDILAWEIPWMEEPDGLVHEVAKKKIGHNSKKKTTVRKATPHVWDQWVVLSFKYLSTQDKYEGELKSI